MLTLYYKPGACSIASHIALREAGLEFSLERVENRMLSDGTPLSTITPKGYTPALRLEDGQILTEGCAILQYVADRNPTAGLAPPPGTLERARLQEWLEYIAVELHRGLGPLRRSDLPEPYIAETRASLAEHFGFVETSLGGRPSLLESGFGVADAYLFYTLRSWRRLTRSDLPAGLAAYHAGIASRPSVRATLEAEGLA